MLIPFDLDVTSTTPPGIADKVSTVLGWVMWTGGAVAILGFIIAGIMLALANNSGQSNEATRYVGRVAMGAVLITGASALANFIMN
ncbi:MAG: hypothetical protein Q4P06_08075 [Actinomycetaceae bacterium]|nr:hypothetical protein [Actinomycetaceae bacterium]